MKIKEIIFASVLAGVKVGATTHNEANIEDSKNILVEILVESGIYNERNAFDFVKELKKDDLMKLMEIFESKQITIKSSSLEIWK